MITGSFSTIRCIPQCSRAASINRSLVRKGQLLHSHAFKHKDFNPNLKCFFKVYMYIHTHTHARTHTHIYIYIHAGFLFIYQHSTTFARFVFLYASQDEICALYFAGGKYFLHLMRSPFISVQL
jgi:hypothetical protein